MKKYLIILLILTSCNASKFFRKDKDSEEDRAPQIEYNDFTVPVDNCPECPELKNVDCSDLEYENLMLAIENEELKMKVIEISKQKGIKKIIYKNIGNLNNINSEKIGDLIQTNKSRQKEIEDLKLTIDSNNEDLTKKNKEIIKLKEDNSRKNSCIIPYIFILFLIIALILSNWHRLRK